MELLLLPSPLTSSLSRKASFLKHPFLSDQNSVTIPDVKRYPSARKIKFPHFRAQASESVKAISKSDTGTTDEINQEISSKDEDLVFVAGATGKVGSRTVRELLKLGFRVRAGVRSAQRAETLVQSVQQLKLDDGTSAVEKLEIVECDLEQDKIVPAIGNASIVICCIGASEKEVFDITGPYRIDYQATKNLIDAATVAGVNHFILLTSLGTNKIGFPAAILNLFWGVLIWKRKAEEALIDSGLPYTIVRPGGMERPTDAYKETHNVSLAKEDTLFGGQVSNLQVAELMAFMTKNRDLSYCKVVEVIAETTAPLTPFGDLLSKIPSQQSDMSSRKELQIAPKIDVAASQSIVLGATSSVTEKAPAKTKKPSMTPSSYIIYEDLKPTTSTPRPSTSEADAMAVSVQVAKSKSVPPNAQDSSMKPEKSASVEEPSLKDKQSSGDLSPYVVYDDLKPPTSPSPPTSSSTKGQINDLQAASESTTGASQISVSGSTTTTTEKESTLPKKLDTRPLSPYFVYEDLKPPSSPTPTSSAHRRGSAGAVKPENEVVTSSSGEGVMKKTSEVVVEKELRKAQTQETTYLSPFPMYDDLKPPASPTPSAPKTASSLSESTTGTGSQLSATPDSIVAQAALTDEVEDKKHSSESKSKPLSPFHMYEDLKPPSSPTPSPKTS